jgi:hypothetical protein
MQLKAGWNAAPRYVGEMSCASAACHGQVPSADRESWRSSFAAWSAADPHRAAFTVLYAERSVEICQNLSRDAAGRRLPLNETDYLRLLEQRCIGCHATPTAGLATSPTVYLNGVSCESCHGPASQWLYVHFDKQGQGKAPGFQRTESLADRAAVCVSCHVGPQEIAGELFDVDHELIAAGHPRLAFEFSSYLANLPPHWDTKADTARHEKAFGPESFHFDAWRAGQQQAARQWCAGTLRRAAGNARGPWPELANFECFDCHRGLEQVGRQRSARSAGIPRPATVAFDQWRVIREFSLTSHQPLPQVRAALAEQFRNPSAADIAQQLKLLNEALRGDSEAPLRPLLPEQRAQVLLALVEPSPTERHPLTWDQAVQWFLAVEAFRADLSPSPATDRLAEAAEALEAALLSAAGDSEAKVISQYDGPAAYDFTVIQPAAEQVAGALRAMSSP